MKNSGGNLKILFLGSPSNSFYKRLTKNYIVHDWQDPLNHSADLAGKFDIVISFGYRHILRQELIKNIRIPLVNLHISYLPWNRGADPNLWSFLEKTPSGVSIHQIDAGIDTGPTYAQSEVQHDLEIDTLATSFNKLAIKIENLFFSILPAILSHEIRPKQQEPGGSFHKSKDKQKYLKLLHSGWNTPLRDIWGAACDSK